MTPTLLTLTLLTLLTLTLQTPADMKIKWRRLVRSGTLCDGEETKVELLGFILLLYWI